MNERNEIELVKYIQNVGKYTLYIAVCVTLTR